MKKIGIIVSISACIALSACQTIAQRVSGKEDLLAAAGFNVRPANTPQRLSSLRTLPEDKFVQKTKGDGIEYIFADPIVCNCLYVGNQTAYDAYKSEVFQRNIANQQQLAAETYDSQWSWNGWDGNSWGPGFW